MGNSAALLCLLSLHTTPVWNTGLNWERRCTHVVNHTHVYRKEKKRGNPEKRNKTRDRVNKVNYSKYKYI